MITGLFAKVSKGELLFSYNINCHKKKNVCWKINCTIREWESTLEEI